MKTHSCYNKSEGMDRMKAYIKFMIAMLIFGSIGIFVKDIPLASEEIVFIRTLLGSIFLFFVLLISKQKLRWNLIRKNLPALLCSGCVLALNWMFLFMAYRYTTVSSATILYYMAPLIVMLLSPWLLKEKLTRNKMIGVACAILGIICMNGIGFGGINPTKGFLFGFLSAIFYAVLMITNKKIHDLSGLETAFLQLTLATIVFFPYIAFHYTGTNSLSMLHIFKLLFIGIVHTGIAYYLYFSSLHKLSGQSIALCSYIDPASALVFAVIFLHEPFGWIQCVGALLVLGGAAFGEYRKQEMR